MTTNRRVAREDEEPGEKPRRSASSEIEAPWQTLRALKIVVRALEHIYPDYALIGGLARNLYTEPSATKDADLLVKLSGDSFIRIYEYLHGKGFSIEPEGWGHWMYKLVYRGARVDLVDHPRFRYTGEAAARRRVVSLKDIGRIMVLSPEDLAVLYIVTADLERSNEIIIGRYLPEASRIIRYRVAVGDFDKNYFIRRCGEHGDLVEAMCSRIYSKAVEVVKHTFRT